ncbi:Dopamine receptor 1 [Holothuria leucospilota]|uniref:Dopamine receptor 1 n=1 Tax=Holothuria leucospilota TaxID=206669 RepID=A0A9Q1C885_HOLLE|nr:Dopamine receptor 1 [Holothuria leucospilota]
MMNSSLVNALTGIEEVTPDLIVLALFTAVPVVLVGSFGNICVILAFIRKKSLRTTSNCLTIGLMFSCLCLESYGYPVQCLINLFFITTQPWCYLLGSQNPALSMQITICLFVLTLERYVSITYPFIADKLFTPRRATFTVVFISFYSYVISFFIGGLIWIGKGDLWRQTRRCNWFFITPSRALILTTILHWLILIPVMFILYAHLFMTVRRHIRTISSMQPTATNEPYPSVTANSIASGSVRPRLVDQPSPRIADALRRHTKGRTMREAKSALLLFFVLAVYCFHWVPTTIFVLSGVLSTGNVSPKQYVLLHTVCYSSGAIVPYIYGFGNKRIRREIKSMILPRSCTPLLDDSGNTVYFADTRRMHEAYEYLLMK